MNADKLRERIDELEKLLAYGTDTSEYRRMRFAWQDEMERRQRLRAALDKITKHPDTPRLVMQIACEALEGKEG